MPCPRATTLLRSAAFLAVCAAAIAASVRGGHSPSEAFHGAVVPCAAAWVLLVRPEALRRFRRRHAVYVAALTLAVAAYLAAFSRVSALLKVRWSELPVAVYFLLAMHVVVWGIDRALDAGLSAAFRLPRAARRPRRRYVPKTVLRVALFLAVVTPYVTATFLTHWIKFADGADPGDFLGSPYDRVKFPATDGLDLEGWFIPARDGGADATVIFTAGRGLTKSCFLSYARMLINNDLNVLMLDLRGEGGSGGHTRGFGVLEARDVIGAVRYLRRQRPAASRCVFAYGLSTGASAVITAAAEEPAIRAVVADSAFADAESSLAGALPLPEPLGRLLRPPTMLVASVELGCNLFQAGPVHDIARISPRPVLLVHGQADTTSPIGQARALLGAAGPPALLLRIPQADHAQLLYRGGSEYVAQVLGVFKAVRQGRDAFDYVNRPAASSAPTGPDPEP